MPETVDDLNLLLLTVAETRIVHRDGVRFQGLRYISPLLAAYVEEQVVIRYDSRDILHKGQYICKAVGPDHTSATVSLKDIQHAGATRRRQPRGQITERIAVVAGHQDPRIRPRRHRPTSPEEDEASH